MTDRSRSVDSGAAPWRSQRYQAIALIGRGSSGVVYRVLDRETGAEVALKTLVGHHAESLYRLKSEFRACAGIRHRNLVELYELHATSEDCFFTMEFVDGVDFVRHVRDHLDPTAGISVRFLSAARQLVWGLAALHAAGKLHRDVKPANALVDVSGRTVLLDFGFMVPFGARVLALERSETIAGSLAYMAPEILWGEPPSPASDWYSVGVVLYEALSGVLPFDGSPAHLASRSLERAPRSLDPSIAADLRDLIEALLSGAPARRPGAAEVARVIDGCSAEHLLPSDTLPSPVREELPFVGREPERALLRSAFEQLRTGRSAVVHVRGASGIGKSELVRHFLATVERETDVVVLRGRCHPYETVPYRAFDGLIDSLSRYLCGLQPNAVVPLLPRHASSMVRVFPVLGRVPDLSVLPRRDDLGGDALELRRRGFAALRELLARIADRHRLLLWIDDVQWTDPDSVTLARELLGGEDPPPALVLLSYRGEDRAAAEAFSAFEERTDGRGLVDRTVIDLAPLEDAEARALAESVAAGRLLDVSEAVREAGGSPFFLGQLVRHLMSADKPDGPNRAPALSDVLRSRLAQLGADARALLEIVAVAGRAIEPRVALAAARIPVAARRDLIGLQEERLLRLGSAGADTVEMYHDRVREMVVADLQPAALRERHRSLAHTLVAERRPDAHALYRHFVGAGERAPAADWAAVAAARADDALAFTDAAELYGAAAELCGATDARYWNLLVQRASALANAGRGAEAAPIFLAASSHTGSPDPLGLRRRAAEQFMQTGRMDEGLSAMRSLLGDLGLRYPRSTALAAMATVARLGMIAVTGARPSARSLAMSGRETLQLETSRSAAKGFAMVDPFRGVYFAVRSLALALRSGDPRFVARELAGVGVTLVPAGPPFAGWAGRMIDRARTTAEACQDPYLLGFTAITLAQKRMVQARWKEMLDLCDEGERILREQCTGVSWEVGLATGAAERAVEEIGDVHELVRRAEAGLQRAEDLDDMYRTVWGLENLAMARIAQDRIEEARDAVRRARTRWTPTGFHMQHLYMFRADVYADLADGRVREAFRRVEEAWPQIARSNLLRHALLRTDAYLVRARVLLAVALRDPGSRAQLLARALADARVLESQRRPDATAHAKVIRSAAAYQSGDREGAATLLERAHDAFRAIDMRVCAGLTSICLSELRSATTRPDIEAHGQVQLSRIGVVRPERLRLAFVPGLSPE